MTFLSARISKPFMSLAVALILTSAQQSFACGGFFCDFVPINQAGEQIVFRQEGSQTTAMIKIDYVGNAEDFGWVLPVPQTPEISLGSDQTFIELELRTRPQFLLTQVGQGCEVFSSSSSSSSSNSSSSSSSSSGGTGVIVEKVVSVGPFDAQVVSSDDPTALAQWLDDNNLDLTDQGSDLLAPYIAANQKFVVLKLKNNTNVGSIQPIILEYQSNSPVIPMTLTAVAAQDNMGVLVWLLGDGRGVPENYKHVIPNYTRLNWYRGTRSAYASYQTLITQAMDEAGGQGFATDFAGYLPNLPALLSDASQWEVLLEQSTDLPDSAFIEELWLFSGSSVVQNAIRTALPTSDTFIYSQALAMEEVFTIEQLAEARVAIAQTIQDQLIDPVNNSIDLLDDNLYLTRLYTTLSADEMTENPVFTFNTAMDNQPLTRNATLTAECVDNQTNWTLKLGAGTGRDDELVIEGWGLSTPFGPAITSADQEAAWQVEKTSATNDPVLLAQNDFPVAVLGSTSSSSSSSSSSSTSSSSSGNSSNTSSSGGNGGGTQSGGLNGLTIGLLTLILSLGKLLNRRKYH